MAHENPYRPDKPTQPYKVKKKASVGWCIFWFFIGLLIPIGTLGVVVGLVPVGSLLNMFGLKNAVSDNIANKSIIGLANYVPQLTVGDIPYIETAVNEALEKNGFDKYISIDWSVLSDVRFTSSTLGQDIYGAMTINVSLKNLEEDKYLTIDPNIKKMPCFNSWVEVTETVDPAASDFVAGLYYYDTTENDGDSTNSNYARAFKDDKTYVDGVTSATKLYLVNMYEANLLECASVLASRLQVEKASDVLAALSTSTSDNSIIEKIVADRTVGELAGLTADDIKISLFLVEGDPTYNQELIDIIKSLVNDKEYADISLGDLTSGRYSVKNIKIGAILKKDDIEQEGFVEVLQDVTGKTWDDITIADLEAANVDDIVLYHYKPYEGNETFYAVIMDLSGKTDYKEVTMGDINDINDFSGLHLITVITNTENPIYDVLMDLTGLTSPSDITVSSINSITSFNNLHLSAVLPLPTASDPTNEDLYNILSEATNKEPADITIGDLSSFSMDGVKLTTVIPVTSTNEKLYSILRDMTGAATNDDITVASLSDADPQKIKVFDAVDPLGSDVQGSSFLRALYEYSPDVTVGNIGEKLNELPLSDVYGSVCWTQSYAEAVSGDVYTLSHATSTDPTTGTTKTTDVYTYSYTSSLVDLSGDNWYISKEAGCWLIFCNDIVYDVDTSLTHPTGYSVVGRPYTLTQDTDFTIAQLENQSSVTASKITHTTIYTLILTDLVEDSASGYSDAVKRMTIQDMIDFAETYLPYITA